MEISKLPWKIDQGLIVGEKFTIADPVGHAHWPSHQKATNAEFIVNACNCHDDLLAACKALLGADLYADGEGLVSFDFPNTEDGDAAKLQAETAIAKAQPDT